MNKKEKCFKIFFVLMFLSILILPIAVYAATDTPDYTVTIKIDENTSSTIKPISTTKNYTFPKNTFTKSGYTFVGWKILNISNSDKLFLEGENLDLSTMTTTKKISIIPMWAKPGEFYTLIFNGNGSKDSAPSNICAQYDKTYNLPENIFKLKGYSFTGWNTKPDGSGNPFGNKSSFKNLCSKKSSTITLYARWKKDSYTITYNLDKGENNSSNPSSYSITTNTITLAPPSRTGYTFLGWYSDSSFTTQVSTIPKGSTGNKTLYAKWSTNKYTITFNGNGATQGSTPNLLALYNKSHTLPENGYKLPGYSFTGWNTKSDGSGKSFGNKASVKNLCSTNSYITLYAQWKKEFYTITYNLDKGENNSSNPSSYSVTTNTITLAPPSRTGYTFLGWYSNSSFTTQVSTIPKGSTGNKTLYAKWSTNKYTITFNGNGAKQGSTPNLLALYNKSHTLPENGYKLPGYSFTGWNTKSDGSGKSFGNKASVKNLCSTNSYITLYARWKKDSYTITYNLDKGENNNSNPSSYSVTTNTITLAPPSRTGYTFLGWYSDSSFTKKVSTIPKGSTGNKTLYAKWSTNKYTITFNGNGATQGSTPNLLALYNKSHTLPENGYKLPGYSFTSWNTKSDGSGKSFGNKASVKNLCSTNSYITLYARWKKDFYTITYNLDKGENNSSNPNSYSITTNTITLAPPSRTGYTFLGWYSDSSFTTKVSTIPKGSTGNKTLYAKWSTNKYIINFNGNGAKQGSTPNLLALYNKSHTLPENGYKLPGYSFTGWNTKPDGSGKSFGNKASVKNLCSTNSTIILYAIWKPIEYEIKFNGNGSTSGSTSSILAKYDTSYILTANGFTKTGYTFTGWNTKPDGSGISYKDKSNVINLTTTNGVCINLYAQWEFNYTKISLGVVSPSQNEIKAFFKKYPISTVDTFEREPVTTGAFTPGILSKQTIQYSLNAINNIRYVAGLNSNITENSSFSYNASCASFVNYLNQCLSHYPAVPNQMSSTDEIYQTGYYGANHSNLAWGYGSIYHSILGYMEDSDSSNIDRVGHRRWLLYPYLSQVGFGKTGSFSAIQVIDGNWYGNSNKSIAWPAQNTPTQFFLNGSAWSLSMGKAVDASKIKVTVTSKSNNKTWNFSNTSSDGFFNVENSYYGDPGCIIFSPNNIDTSAGKSYTVNVYFDDTKTKIQYDVNFFSL